MDRREFIKLTGLSGLLVALGFPKVGDAPPPEPVPQQVTETEPERISGCVCVDIPGSLIITTAKSEIQKGELLYLYSDGCVSNEASTDSPFLGYAWNNAWPGGPVTVVVFESW